MHGLQDVGLIRSASLSPHGPRLVLVTSDTPAGVPRVVAVSDQDGHLLWRLDTKGQAVQAALVDRGQRVCSRSAWLVTLPAHAP